jgi:hypothetical protein
MLSAPSPAASPSPTPARGAREHAIHARVDHHLAKGRGEERERGDRKQAEAPTDHDPVGGVLVPRHHVGDGRSVVRHVEAPYRASDTESQCRHQPADSRLRSHRHGPIVPAGGRCVDYPEVMERVTLSG